MEFMQSDCVDPNDIWELEQERKRIKALKKKSTVTLGHCNHQHTSKSLNKDLEKVRKNNKP